MDDDIRANLKEVEDHLHTVARQVGSKKSSIESLVAMEECLSDAAKTVRVYVGIQKDRDSER